MSSGGTTMTQQQPQPNALQQSNGSGPMSGKKPSNGSSGGPTPAGTPVQNGTGQQGSISPPLTSGAPKYGRLT